MDGFPINYADLIVFAVIVLSGVFALVRGFVHEFLTLGAWIGAGIATYYGIESQRAGVKIEGEKAHAQWQAHMQIQIAKMKLAAGQTVVMPELALAKVKEVL